jgi:hypothetical protein
MLPGQIDLRRISSVHWAPRWLSSIAAAVICVSAGAPAYGIPANPAIVQLTQPDGTKFNARNKGDERQSWVETEDGYTIVRNTSHCLKDSGKSDRCWWEYAVKDERGNLVPSGMAVTDGIDRIPADRRPPKGLRPPRRTEPR